MKQGSLFRVLILVIICSGIIGLICTDSITVYLHPRSIPLIYVALAVLIALISVELSSVIKQKQIALKRRWLLMILPVIAVALVKPTGLSSQIAKQKGVSSMILMNKNRDKPTKPKTCDAILAAEDTTTDTSAMEAIDARFAEAHENGDRIVERLNGIEPVATVLTTNSNQTDTLDGDLLYLKLVALFENLETIDGKRIAMTGFVTPDTSVGQQSFFLARMMVTCCSADAVPVGLYCAGKTVPAPNSWITVVGTLKKRVVNFPGSSQPELIPLLQIESITPAEKPKREYVYQMF